MEDRLILGRNPDSKPSSESYTPLPVETGSYVYGVGYMGDGDEDNAYYGEISSASHQSMQNYRKGTHEDSPYALPNKPGAAAYELRIREEELQQYSPSSKVLAQDRSASKIKHPMRKVQRRGRPVDSRAVAARTQAEGAPAAAITRQNRRLDTKPAQYRRRDLGDDTERFTTDYVEMRRGGRHTLIMDIDDYDDYDGDEILRM
jgi:hypothetical protein